MTGRETERHVEHLYGVTYVGRTVPGGGAWGTILKWVRLIEGPVATTGDATDITETGAKLNGTVNPSGTATSYDFE